MPLVCVDTIIHKGDSVLLGWRIISPYRNVWALLGGRVWYGESFVDTSVRNCRQSGIVVQRPKYVGLFPVRFPKGRHDVAVCMAARYVSGETKSTNELSRYTWINKANLEKVHPIGGNYVKMLKTWRKNTGKQEIE